MFAKDRFAGQLHSILVVDGDDLDLHDVPDLANAIHAIDILVVELADVAQTVAPRQYFDEGPEILDGSDPSFVNLADANFLGQGFHLELGGFGAG